MNIKETLDTIYDIIDNTLYRIALNNKDFICSDCLKTAQNLIAISSIIWGNDVAEHLERNFNTNMENE